MIRYKELRLACDLHQQDIADILNVKRSTYSKWENLTNDMDLETANQLANYYHVSLDYLLGISNHKLEISSSLSINWDLFSQRLKMLRKEKSLTQQTLSDKVGFPQTTYSQYEKGTRKPTTLKILTFANYFHVSFDYLVGRTNEKDIL